MRDNIPGKRLPRKSGVVIHSWAIKDMNKTKPEYYEWWVDMIQDCLAQISKDFNKINPNSNSCKHICDETYHDFSHFIECVIYNGYNDIPINIFDKIVMLNKHLDYDNDDSRSLALEILNSVYFCNRKRWQYGSTEK